MIPGRPSPARHSRECGILIRRAASTLARRRRGPSSPVHLVFGVIFFLGASFSHAATLQGHHFGARQAGLGAAVTAAGAAGVYGIFYNPAQLAFASTPEATMDYARLWMGLLDDSALEQSYLGFSIPWQGLDGSGRGAGLARSEFGLSSPVYGKETRLFEEEVWYGSFASIVSNSARRGRLGTGVTVKRILRSYGNTEDGANALNNQGAPTYLQDPVLAGSPQKSAWSFDAGVSWRHRAGLALGFVIQDLFEPDLSLGRGSNADPLFRTWQLGAGWAASPFLTFMANFEMKRRLESSTDQRWTLGAERSIPVASFGEFGFRGSLSREGSRDMDLLTLGAAWRLNAVGLDYAYQASMGGARALGATHRFTLTIRYGEPGPEEEISRLYQRERRVRLQTQAQLEQALDDLQKLLQAEPGKPVFASTAPLRAPEPPKPPPVKVVLRDPREDEFNRAWSFYLERKAARAPRSELARTLAGMIDAYGSRPGLSGEWQAIQDQIDQDRQDYSRVWAAYQRLAQEPGVSPKLLQQTLERIRKRFEGSGVDLSDVESELSRLRLKL